MRLERLRILPAPNRAATVRRAVVAVGNFDGVHLGHQAALDLARREADRIGGDLVVVTFDPHPARHLRPADAPRAAATFSTRVEQLRAAGADRLVVLEFNDRIAAATPAEFARRLLADGLGAACLVQGENFRFGRRRSGGLETLRKLGQDLGFAVLAAPTARARGEVISSTRLRRALAAGDLGLVEELCGRAYEIRGAVEPGAGRGRLLGFPTANLAGAADLALRPGVYAAEAEPDPGRRGPPTRFPAVVHCGPRPTFGDAASLEAHLIGFSGVISSLCLHLRAFLRETATFDGPQALRRQIARDIARARNLHRLWAVSDDRPAAALDPESFVADGAAPAPFHA